ncbi:hypothetical protein D3H55_15310 [Bacillus salacetis]|uniref:Lipoprotein n=1 Tax=Bacillus salacetis TaxID=2315464 RepID=A0A3A1QWR1_9BACI|nr:hypothetical protein [Bacillus salacetis]RIW31340.1 hypothetical protein D3H55_15310 [Bacillus salacetis]
MKRVLLTCLLIIFVSVSTACETTHKTGASPAQSNRTSLPECDTTGVIVDWVDFLIINDITYEGFHRNGEEPEYEKGKEIGVTSFKLDDCASPDYISQNGDAAYLEAGTPIYEVKGYPVELMVEAGGSLYIAERNEAAETVADLYPIKGKVKDLHLLSTENDSWISTFTKENKKAFLNELLKLEVVDPSSLRNGW